MAGYGELFGAFVNADEVGPVMESFTALRTKVLQEHGANLDHPLDLLMLLKAKVEPTVPYRSKQIFTVLQEALRKRQELREGSGPGNKKVVVSGAGPVGLRGAVEAALLGHNVVMVEKRTVFSRVNILLFWDETMADMVTLGAKYFYPEMKVHGGFCHMGTREIQLCLLKTALLLGVEVHYDSSLNGLLFENGKWHAVATTNMSKRSSVRNSLKRLSDKTLHALNFKPNKMDDYRATFVCNMVDEPKVDPSFLALKDGKAQNIPFDALMIAEGEWSQTSRKLGFKKTVDKFKQAIGMVINLDYDKANKDEYKLQSFKSTLNVVNHPVISKLNQAGIVVENIEYLKGTTHYIVVTISKLALLDNKVLKQDCPTSKDLLSASNLDFPMLKEMARKIATITGVPSSAPFCKVNPIQIFDFSSRARVLNSVKFLNGKNNSITEEPSRQEDDDNGSVALVLPIGDTALEPFWPQGLGSNRGFHSAMDAAFAVTLWKTNDIDTVYREREFAYTVMNSYSWTAPLKPITQFQTWTTDPTVRYSLLCLKAGVDLMEKKGIPTPERILKKLNLV